MEGKGGDISTERFLYLCKECGITHDDMESMTIGMILDYIDEYLLSKNPNAKKNEVITNAELVPWL